MVTPVLGAPALFLSVGGGTEFPVIYITYELIWTSVSVYTAYITLYEVIW